MAAVQIRNRGTLGGNFCSGVPSADTPPICIAGRAEVGSPRTRRDPARSRRRSSSSARAGSRWPRARSSPRSSSRRCPPRSGASYQRFALRRATALAVAGVAAMVELLEAKIREARVVLGRGGPDSDARRSPATASSNGQEPSDELFSRRRRGRRREAQPISDLRGSASFRRELVRVLTVRALRAAVAPRRRPGGTRPDERRNPGLPARQRTPARPRGEAEHHPAEPDPLPTQPDRDQEGMRARRMRSLHRHHERAAGELLHGPGRGRRRRRRSSPSRGWPERRRAPSAPEVVHQAWRAPVRLLHAGNASCRPRR